MNNTETLNNINKKIEKVTYRLNNNPSNLELLEIELYNLNEERNNYTILSNNGLEFNFINQFNAECVDEISVKTTDNKLVEIKQSFHDNLITKYDGSFDDCNCCGKAKDEMEVQVYVSNLGVPACFDCFEKAMKNDFLLTNCDFEIIHLSTL